MCRTERGDGDSGATVDRRMPLRSRGGVSGRTAGSVACGSPPGLDEPGLDVARRLVDG